MILAPKKIICTLILLLPVMVAELVAYAVEYKVSNFSSVAMDAYLFLKDYFPFSTIADHVAGSSHPCAMSAGMSLLWILAPVTIISSIVQYRNVTYLNTNRMVSHKTLRLIYILGITFGLFNLIFFTPDAKSTFCHGCEKNTLFFSLLIKYMYFWMIGFSAGQWLSITSERKG